MTLISPLKKIEVKSFIDFCEKFNIKSEEIAGDNGTDQELIESELNKILDKKWLINFFDDAEDGYFLCQQIK